MDIARVKALLTIGEVLAYYNLKPDRSGRLRCRYRPPKGSESGGAGPFLRKRENPKTAAANDLAPTADWSHSEGSATTFMAGTFIIFDGSLSHDNDEGGSSITYYKWYVDGSLEKSCSSCSSFGWTFTLASGQTEKSVQIKLRVRDDEGNWAAKTITYTIRRKPGRTYYLKDHLGNVRVTVDEDGNAIGWDDYYPFGKIMPGRSSNNANPNGLYKYTGHERDTEANLNLDYMGARFYDPEIGRFMQVDPKADDFPAWSPYNYTLNNPINLFDPDGRAPLDDYVLLANGQVGRVRTGQTDRFFVREGGQDRQLNLSNASDSRLLSSRLESNGTFLNNVITSETPNQQALGLAGEANVRKGGGESLVTITKVTAFSVGLAGSLLTGSGIIAGSSGVIAAGTTLGTASSFLGAAESVQNGQEGAAVLKIATSQASKIGFDFGKTINSDVERLIFNSFIFIQEGTANLAITGAEAKEQRIKDEEEEERR